MTGKHTPGPWTVKFGGCHIASEATGQPVANVAAFFEDRREEALANANLLAAAPELAKWLQWALLRIATENRGDYFDRAEAALTKALGEQL